MRGVSGVTRRTSARIHARSFSWLTPRTSSGRSMQMSLLRRRIGPQASRPRPNIEKRADLAYVRVVSSLRRAASPAHAEDVIMGEKDTHKLVGHNYTTPDL